MPLVTQKYLPHLTKTTNCFPNCLLNKTTIKKKTASKMAQEHPPLSVLKSTLKIQDM